MKAGTAVIVWLSGDHEPDIAVNSCATTADGAANETFQLTVVVCVK